MQNEWASQDEGVSLWVSDHGVTEQDDAGWLAADLKNFLDEHQDDPDIRTLVVHGRQLATAIKQWSER